MSNQGTATPHVVSHVERTLNATRTRVETLRALAALMTKPPHPEAALPALDTLERSSAYAPDIRPQINRWAVSVLIPLLKTAASTKTGSPERQALWAHPHTLPALLVLERFRSLSTIFDSMPGDVVDDEVAWIWKKARGQGIEGGFEAWRALGERTGYELELHWAGYPPRRSDEWAHVVGHPETPDHWLAQGVAFLARTSAITPYLDRADIFATRAVRLAAWPHGMQRHALATLLIRATPDDEYPELLDFLSDRGMYQALGHAVSVGSATQVGALRISAETFARWCEKVPSQFRPALMAVMGTVLPGGQAPARPSHRGLSASF